MPTIERRTVQPIQCLLNLQNIVKIILSKISVESTRVDTGRFSVLKIPYFLFKYEPFTDEAQIALFEETVRTAQ